MARGHQKIQSQQKNAKKQADLKKSKGHDQKTAAKAALVFTCAVCRSQMPDPKTFKQHFESKHRNPPCPGVRGSGGINGYAGYQTEFFKALYQLCTCPSLTAMDDSM